MATYRADLVQNIQPATADYQALARSAELRGQADVNLLKVLGEVGVSAYKAYQAEDIKSTATGAMVKNEKGELVESNTDLLNAQELTEAFLTRNQAAQKASLLETEARKLAGQQYTYASEFEGGMPYEAQQRDIAQFEAAKAQTLTQYSTEIQRLKEASKGGMSKEEYVARVSAITKKAIAKYPHMSDEIRQQVGIVTGLPYADRWAQMQYVKDMFSKSDSSGGADPLDPRKALASTITAMAKTNLFGTEVQLNEIYHNNPEKFNDIVKNYNEYTAVIAKEQQAVATLQRDVAVADNDADKRRGIFGVIFQTAFGGNVLTSSMKATQDKESPYHQVFELMKQGKNLTTHPGAFETHVKMHVAQMRTNIESAYRTASNQLELWLAKSNVSDGKRNEMRKDLTTLRDIELGRYANENGLIAMSSIMARHKEKTIEQQKTLFEFAIKGLSSFNNNALIQAYFASDASRSRLAIENPNFYAKINQMEETVSSTLQMLRNESEAYSDLEKIASVMRQATAAPASMEIDYIIGDSTMYKATHEAMMGQARGSLDKATAGLPLDKQEVNIISSAFATSAQYGANANQLMNRHQEFYNSLSKLPASQLAIVKENVNNGAKAAIINVMQIKQVLEAKYGMTINLGLNSMGEIAPILSAVDVRNSKAREMISEFTKASRPLIRTAIFARAAVTGEEPKVGGQAFLTAITNNTPPEDFFSLGGAGRGQTEGSPGITNYNYETGEVIPPSIYSGTQAEREAYDEQQRKKIADNIAKMEGKQPAGEAPKPAPQEDTGPISIRDDVEKLTWLNKRQKERLYDNIVRAVKDGSLTNLTRFAKILQTATEEERKKLVESLK